MRGQSKRLGTGLVILAASVAVALPGSASAGFTNVLTLYQRDAVVIPNGHGAARMSFSLGPSQRTVSSVEARFRIRHDRTQQLKLVVKGPNGESVRLSDHETRGANLGAGPCTEDPAAVQFTGFSDSTSKSLASGSAPYVGEWRPNEALSALTGISSEGTWTLVARDTNPAGERGKLRCGAIELVEPP